MRTNVFLIVAGLALTVIPAILLQNQIHRFEWELAVSGALGIVLYGLGLFGLLSKTKYW